MLIYGQMSLKEALSKEVKDEKREVSRIGGETHGENLDEVLTFLNIKLLRCGLFIFNFSLVI